MGNSNKSEIHLHQTEWVSYCLGDLEALEGIDSRGYCALLHTPYDSRALSPAVPVTFEV